MYFAEMEAIDFNNFSQSERYEIIKNFLIKMQNAQSMPSATKFFDYYLKKYYKLPAEVHNDIVYCQRALKTILSLHQTVETVFAEQMDANPTAKDIYMTELEDEMYSINAECQYLLLLLEDDIKDFCKAFIEQNMQLNKDLVKLIVNNAIVPLICNDQLTIKPLNVIKRLTEEQLREKYFTISNEQDQRTPPANSAPKTVPLNVSEPAALVTEMKKKAAPAPIVITTNKLDSLCDVRISRLNLQAALQRALDDKDSVIRKRTEVNKENYI